MARPKEFDQEKALRKAIRLFSQQGFAATSTDDSVLAWSHRCGYTMGMKTAVSIPDDIFKGAERLARKTKRSRSRLFSDALKEYLARHTPDSVTEAMDRARYSLSA